MLRWILKDYHSLSIDELYAAMKLRQEIFVVEQNCPYLDADGKDQHSHHLFGYDNETLVTYCRLVQPGVSYTEVSIGRVVVRADFRERGYGHQLMEKALQVIEEQYGTVPVRIGAQSYLIAFYGKHGFGIEGNTYLEDGIPHHIMLRS